MIFMLVVCVSTFQTSQFRWIFCFLDFATLFLTVFFRVIVSSFHSESSFFFYLNICPFSSLIRTFHILRHKFCEWFDLELNFEFFHGSNLKLLKFLVFFFVRCDVNEARRRKSTLTNVLKAQLRTKTILYVLRYL